MYQFIKKLISIIIILAVFLFGNMAIVHAISDSIHTEIITHSHDDGITESHVVETTDNKEPPHCSETKIDTSITQQVRDTIDIPDVFKGSLSSYGECNDFIYPLTQDIYLKYYPGSENHFFGHLLVGEKILMI